MIVNTEPSIDFLPVPDELLVNLFDSKHLVIDLLENLPRMFEDTTVFDSNLAQAIKALGMITKPTGGKVFLFASSPLSNKFPHLRPTEKPGVAERNELMQSTNSLFKNTANELSHFYVSVD
jgi:protein transport protein SEC24